MAVRVKLFYHVYTLRKVLILWCKFALSFEMRRSLLVVLLGSSGVRALASLSLRSEDRHVKIVLRLQSQSWPQWLEDTR